jgi:hypothetical protein
MNEHFDKSFREWAARRSDTPGEAAAREIVRALPPRRPRRLRASAWLLAAAAPAAALIVATIVWRPVSQPLPVGPSGRPAPAAVSATARATALPTVLVMPLDAKTTLYLMLE